ncbi:MAG: hypothetical protein GY696_05250 [Gammaproteobacteria bacterium]|nr:hypothetical protein [Gammaproteobacteria bacterium]
MDENQRICEYPKWKEEKPQNGSCEPFVQFNYPVEQRKKEYNLLVNHIDNTTAVQTSPDTETITTAAGESSPLSSSPLSTTTLGGHPDAETTVTSNTTTDGATRTCGSKILLFHSSRNPRSTSLPQIYHSFAICTVPATIKTSQISRLQDLSASD